MPNTPTSPTDRLLTQEEVAARLGIHRRTVLNWRRKGLLPCVQVGTGFIRFKQSDIDKLLSGGD
jgi:excisionase family DNA binding protein